MFLSIVGIFIKMVGSLFMIQTQEQLDIMKFWLKPFLSAFRISTAGNIKDATADYAV